MGILCMRRMARSGARLLAAAALTLVLGAVEARADIVFTLSGVTFDDGATATGTFTTNDSITSVLDWDITTSAGALPGFQFNKTNAPVNFSALPTILVLEDANPDHILQLGFIGGLTAAGALITPNDPAVSFEQAFTAKRIVTGGSVVTGAVPEPSSLALAGMAVTAGLGLRARRRRAASRVG
jgi:PEP-CTERM motif